MIDAHRDRADEDEQAPDWFVETWRPRVGDRVRCVPSPECRVVAHPDSLQGAAGDVGHETWETGLTGTVVDDRITSDLLGQGHTVCVRWDGPMHPYNGDWVNASVYAPIELELLPPAHGRAGPREEGT